MVFLLILPNKLLIEIIVLNYYDNLLPLCVKMRIQIALCVCCFFFV